jgi:hypothetical protein
MKLLRDRQKISITIGIKKLSGFQEEAIVLQMLHNRQHFLQQTGIYGE